MKWKGQFRKKIVPLSFEPNLMPCPSVCLRCTCNKLWGVIRNVNKQLITGSKYVCTYLFRMSRDSKKYWICLFFLEIPKSYLQHPFKS